MSFDPVYEVKPNPDVRIFFDGLLLLCPEQDDQRKRCDVHVHKSNHHALAVEVSVDQAQPSFPFLRLGRKQLGSRLEITTDRPQGVSKFVGGSAPAYVYPFCEAIDFQTIHNNSVQVDPNGCRPGVLTLRDGVLYTAAQMSKTVSLRRNGYCKDVDSLGIIIGANVYLNGGQLFLRWDGGEQTLPLFGGEKYVISINNTRPFVPDNQQSGSTGDFKHYYDALTGVDRKDQFELFFEPCEISIENTDRIPCMSAVVGG
jgi:hypothetical protein